MRHAIAIALAPAYIACIALICISIAVAYASVTVMRWCEQAAYENREYPRSDIEAITLLLFAAIFVLAIVQHFAGGR
jgi:hypothetical protein